MLSLHAGPEAMSAGAAATQPSLHDEIVQFAKAVAGSLHFLPILTSNRQHYLFLQHAQSAAQRATHIHSLTCAHPANSMCDWHGSVTHSCSSPWRMHFIPCSLHMRAATPQEEVNKTTALRKVQSAVQAAFKGTPQAGSVKVRCKPQTLNLVVLQVPNCAGSCHHPAGCPASAGCPAAVTVGSRCFCSSPHLLPGSIDRDGCGGAAVSSSQ